VLPATERHPHARAVLGGALPPAGTPSHAYLFHGPAGSGKATVARAFAVALLSDGAPDPKSVRARVEHGVHPDLTWVTPSGATEMLVSDIDEPVVAAASRTPFEARRRVFVIERAETMNDQAANRMLKTLEEPAAFAHLMLLTDRPGEILPTIASRCLHVRFDAPSAQEIAARLHDVDELTAEACARLALGDARRAALLAHGDGPALRAGSESYARGALRGELQARPWLDVLARAKALGDDAHATVERRIAEQLEFLPARDRRRTEREGAEAARRAARRARAGALEQALALVGLWYRDVAALADGAPEVVHAVDRLDALGEDAERADVHRLRAAVELVDEARAMLIVYPGEELLLEALAYRLARTLAAPAPATATA
jgi:DNA polymerase III subunit delta'